MTQPVEEPRVYHAMFHGDLELTDEQTERREFLCEAEGIFIVPRESTRTPGWIAGGV